MSRPLAAGILLVALLASPAGAIEPKAIASGLRFPAGIAFASDGTMFVTEREGRILAIEGGDRQVVGSIQTTTSGEAGLLGIAVSPDDRFVFVFATAPDGASNRVYRVPVEGGDARVIVGDLPAGTYHNGGGIAFGPDGMLYVSNGETHEVSRAQDPDELGGKVYRFTPQGDVPSDNPFGGSPAYAVGLRNPFGLAIDPVSGAPFVTENGPQSYDEVNRIEAGGNYGWPVVSGPASGEDTGSLRGEYHDPLLAFENIIVPTGIAFADPDGAVRSVRGDLFFATYGEQTIRRARLNESRDRARDQEIWYESPEPVIALAWGPRGLYYSTPGAVRVFELASEGAPGSRVPLPDDAPSPRRSLLDDGDRATPPDEGFPTALVLVGGALALLVAALAFAFWPRRS